MLELNADKSVIPRRSKSCSTCRWWSEDDIEWITGPTTATIPTLTARCEHEDSPFGDTYATGLSYCDVYTSCASDLDASASETGEDSEAQEEGVQY